MAATGEFGPLARVGLAPRVEHALDGRRENVQVFQVVDARREVRLLRRLRGFLVYDAAVAYRRARAVAAEAGSSAARRRRAAALPRQGPVAAVESGESRRAELGADARQALLHVDSALQPRLLLHLLLQQPIDFLVFARRRFPLHFVVQTGRLRASRQRAISTFGQIDLLDFILFARRQQQRQVRRVALVARNFSRLVQIGRRVGHLPVSHQLLHGARARRAGRIRGSRPRAAIDALLSLLFHLPLLLEILHRAHFHLLHLVVIYVMLVVAAADARVEAHVVDDHDQDAQYVDGWDEADELQGGHLRDLRQFSHVVVEGKARGEELVEAGAVVAAEEPEDGEGDVLDERPEVVDGHLVLVDVVLLHVHVREVVPESENKMLDEKFAFKIICFEN